MTRNLAIYEAWKHGVSTSELAIISGMPEHQVKRIIYHQHGHLGLPLDQKLMRDALILDLLEQGDSVSLLAKLAKIDRGSVYYIRKKHQRQIAKSKGWQI